MPKGQGRTYDFLNGLIGHQDAKCVKWPFYTNPNGYGQVGWHRKLTYAHRVMCELAHGAPPTPKHEAAHKCGNGHQGCVNPNHLIWRTKSENRQESTSHGKGGRHGYGSRGKLTDEQVAEIRASRGIVRNVDLAEKFGVSWTTINSILNGHHRKCAPAPPL